MSSVGSCVARHEESVSHRGFEERFCCPEYTHTSSSSLPPLSLSISQFSERVTSIMLQTAPLLSSFLFQIWKKSKRVAVATTSQRQWGFCFGREEALWVTENPQDCCRAQSHTHTQDPRIKWWLNSDVTDSLVRSYVSSVMMKVF